MPGNQKKIWDQKCERLLEDSNVNCGPKLKIEQFSGFQKSFQLRVIKYK